MLTINEQLFGIDEAIDEVVISFLKLESVINYKIARDCFLSDQVLQEKIRHFQSLQQEFEELQRYQSIRSEVINKRRALFREKRMIDMDDNVKYLRQNEVAVQDILARLSQKISSAISPDIFVDTGLPLAPHTSHHRNCNKGERKNDV